MTQGSTAGRTPQDELEDALRALAENDALEVALRDARGAVAAHAAEVTAAAELLRRETDDVRRLGGFSWRRLGAAVRGTTYEDLLREKAEQARAEAGHVLAVDRHAAAVAHVESIEARLAGSRDAAPRVARARAALEAWVIAQGGEDGRRLEDVAGRAAALRAEATEIAEAQSAASTAAALLARACESLRSAGGWATYDTFFGGGFVGDLMKYEAIDRATEELRAANDALVRLDAELSDVRLAGVGGVGIGEMTRVADVWFDWFLSDLTVRDKIADARTHAERTLAAVQQVETELGSRAGTVAGRLRVLDEERAEILAAR